MFKWFNNAIKPKLQKLKPGSRIVAHDFDIDDWKPTKIEHVSSPKDGSDYAESRTLYIWIVGDNAMPWGLITLGSEGWPRRRWGRGVDSTERLMERIIGNAQAPNNKWRATPWRLHTIRQRNSTLKFPRPSFAARLNACWWGESINRRATGRSRCCSISMAARGITRIVALMRWWTKVWRAAEFWW